MTNCKKKWLLIIILFFTFYPFNNNYASFDDKRVKFASGGNHNLWIKSDGTLWSWGNNLYGQLGDSTNTDRKSPIQIGSENVWIKVSAGAAHSIGLKSDGTLWAWGKNDSGQLGDSTNTIKKSPVQIGTDNKWAAATAGGDHTICLKSDGTLWAWGYNVRGQLGLGDNNNRNIPVQIGTDNNWVSITAGWMHTIGLKSDGTLWAWGYNEYGQLGDGTNGTGTNKNTPVQVGTDDNWVAISSGLNHNIGLRSDGTICAWGSNDSGQLGDSTNYDSNIPIQVGSDNKWIKISAGGTQGGGSHSAGLKSDGTLWTWGYNYYGQLGDGTNGAGTNKNIPVKIGSNNKWTTISAGGYHTIGLISDGTLWTWGYNAKGQLGLGDINNKNTPNQSDADTGNKWTKILAGDYYALGLKSDGTLWAWGLNDDGQLGDSTNDNRNIPVQAGSDNNWITITAGGSHAIGLKSDGTLWAWGLNINGQLGDNTITPKNVPVQIDSNDNWTAVNGGGSHTIGLRTDGTLWGWGLNNNGQLGDGTNTDSTVPVQINSDNNWTAASCGLAHTLGLKSNGTLWAWGNNDYGQLGDSMAGRNIPAQVGTENNWVSISAGDNHTIGLRSDGTLWTCGYNNYGQLGDSTNTDSNIPARVGGDNKWTKISGGGDHTIGIKSDGTLWTWGRNVSGQLGDGTNDDRYVPAQIGVYNKWTEISGGFGHSAGLRSDGSFIAWGNNEYGQLGNGTNNNTNSTGILTILATPGSGGTISPSGSINVNTGIDTTFIISPNTGYHIENVLVDSASVGAVSMYPFSNVTADHTISASFAINTYTITASAGSGGNIAPSGIVTVNYGSNLVFNFSKNTGYHIENVLVDSTSAGIDSTYTFINVTGNHTISVSYDVNPPIVYTISASAGSGGTISPSGNVNINSNNDTTFNISADTGYHVLDVLVDSASVGAVLMYPFSNVISDRTISASFAINTYTVTASAGSGGSISPSGDTTVIHGTSQTFNIYANNGYHIFDVLIDSASAGTDSTYTLSNVISDRTINASFAINTYTINATAGSGGSISPSSGVTVNYGTSKTFNIAANNGYHIFDVLIDSASAGTDSTYTLSNVISDRTINASFAINTYTITASAGSGGSITPSATAAVDHGSSRTYNIAANEGYYIADVLVNNVSAGSVSTHIFNNITGNNVISVSFAANQIPSTPVGNIDTASPGSADRIDGHDLYLFSKSFGSQPGGANWNTAANLDNRNNIIDGEDLILLAANFGKKN